MTFDEWWAAEGWTEHDKANPRAAWTFDDLRETAKEAWEAALSTPPGMTAKKLRAIAGWMDILDSVLNRVQVPGSPDWKQKLDRARGLEPRDEVQRDLREWADEVERRVGPDRVPSSPKSGTANKGGSA